MLEWLDWFSFQVWFRERGGYPMWGWYVGGFMLALIVSAIIGVFFGWDFPHRCTPEGDCWPEY